MDLYRCLEFAFRGTLEACGVGPWYARQRWLAYSIPETEPVSGIFEKVIGDAAAQEGRVAWPSSSDLIPGSMLEGKLLGYMALANGER